MADKMTLERLRQLIIAKENPPTLMNAARTAVAVVVSLFVARLFPLPETYWAAISAMIVMQSTLGEALPISAQRIVGTALGAIFGGFVGMYFPGNVAAFVVAVFVIGLLCAALKMDRGAYRHAGFTLAIVMLVPRAGNEWVIAIHRFFEVSIGVVVGLGLSAAWPERTSGPATKLDDSVHALHAEEGN
jgi:uncharacterized membrane protein YccC